MDTPDWQGVQALDRVARLGTMTAAARALGVSVPTVGRRLDALEAQTGLRLVRRSAGGVAPTADGERFLGALRPGLEALSQAPRIVRQLRARVDAPPIRISATEPILTDILAPNLRALLDAVPGLTVEFESSNAIARLAQGEADIAIRMVRPVEPSLVARRLPAIRLGLYRSPGGSRAGSSRATTRFDPATDRLCWYDAAFGSIAENVFLDAQGWGECVVLRASSVRTLQRTVERTSLIGPLPDFLARAAGLERVDAPALPARTPWLAFHADTRREARHRRVRDWIAASFREALGPRG